MWQFKPDTQSNALAVPFYEDARADTAPYYSSTKGLKTALNEVSKEMVKLGAFVTNFQSGKFDVNKQARFGYVIEFVYGGATGRIQVAGLPIRWYTAGKETRVRVQCLLNVRDWLKAAVTMQVFSPDTSPLIPYLLVRGNDGRDYTLADLVLNKGQLPALASQSVTVERE